MSPSKASGLGTQTSTRPTREERRREVERVQAEPQQQSAPMAAIPPPPAAAPPKLEPRRRTPKVPFNTYVHPSTQRRVEWFRVQGGYTVTDIVEAALNEFLDKEGAPKIGDSG
jgi:hypothetical protein